MFLFGTEDSATRTDDWMMLRRSAAEPSRWCLLTYWDRARGAGLRQRSPTTRPAPSPDGLASGYNGQPAAWHMRKASNLSGVRRDHGVQRHGPAHRGGHQLGHAGRDVAVDGATFDWTTIVVVQTWTRREQRSDKSTNANLLRHRVRRCRPTIRGLRHGEHVRRPYILHGRSHRNYLQLRFHHHGRRA